MGILARKQDPLTTAQAVAASALGLFDTVVDSLEAANELLDHVAADAQQQIQEAQERLAAAQADTERNSLVAKRIAALTS